MPRADDANSLLLMLWEGIVPFWFPIALLVLLVAFRGLWAQLFAEAVFIYRRRLESLERPVRAGRFRRQALRTFWADCCLWRTALERDDPAAAAALAKALTGLRTARPFFAPGADAERLAAWEERLRAAAAADRDACKALAAALAAEVPAYLTENEDTKKRR